MSQQSDSKPETTRTAFEVAGEGAPPSLLREFRDFIFENKKWWLIPILLVMSLVGLLVVLSSTGAAPFIYTLF